MANERPMYSVWVYAPDGRHVTTVEGVRQIDRTSSGKTVLRGDTPDDMLSVLPPDWVFVRSATPSQQGS